ncbi:Jacalin-like lectin domain-containing protein [Triangularia setosa]|uniref:Jacalin-like lectin domain-containing protein n=1 Tax=Triangularia setosa TaxID=2587417 RepID=A0AAN6W4G4_9PEZI|nr:Jacalin-like lectin domain-containing protein [Podospora setosa]
MPGSQYGSSFADTAVNSDLTEIRIRCGSRVDSIRCFYANTTSTPVHGGNGGSEEIFRLGKDEAIITMWVWCGSDIDAIQFQTTTGRVSPKYGGGGGGQFILRGHNGRRERALMGFRGRASGILYNLEPIWSDTRQLGTLNVAVGDRMGTTNGTSFDMLSTITDPFPANLKSIKVRSGSRIDAIECIFNINGQMTPSGRKGGGGGGEGIFTLNNNERIIRVEGRAGSRIDRLQFFTDQNRFSPIYGGNGGSPFVWTPPFDGTASAANANMCLLCFQGTAQGEVYRLAPVWAADPPVKFSLIIDTYDTLTQEMTGKPEIGWSDQRSSTNKTDQIVSHKATWTMEAHKSSTVTLSQESRTKVGGRVYTEITVKGKAGVPFLAEGEVEAKAGVEVTSEHEWGKSTTDGETVARTFTVGVEESINIPPCKRMIGKAVGYQMKISGLKWRGTMRVTYAGGSTKDVPVEGSMDSVSVTRIHTSYEFEDI